jgi:hypothetical protein
MASGSSWCQSGGTAEAVGSGLTNAMAPWGRPAAVSSQFSTVRHGCPGGAAPGLSDTAATERPLRRTERAHRNCQTGYPGRRITHRAPFARGPSLKTDRRAPHRRLKTGAAGGRQMCPWSRERRSPTRHERRHLRVTAGRSGARVGTRRCRLPPGPPLGSALGTRAAASTRLRPKSSQIAIVRSRIWPERNHPLSRHLLVLEASQRSSENRGVPVRVRVSPYENYLQIGGFHCCGRATPSGIAPARLPFPALSGPEWCVAALDTRRLCSIQLTSVDGLTASSRAWIGAMTTANCWHAAR